MRFIGNVVPFIEQTVNDHHARGHEIGVHGIIHKAVGQHVYNKRPYRDWWCITRSHFS